MKIYISGKISGLPIEEAKQRFANHQEHHQGNPEGTNLFRKQIHCSGRRRSMIFALNENFSAVLLGTFKRSNYFCGVLQSSKAVTSRKHNPLAVFLCAFGKAYRHRTPPWKSVMEILPLMVKYSGKGDAVFLLTTIIL